MFRSIALGAALLLSALSSGCVTRRYVITSDPPGAVVYRDGQPIGATPVEEPFLYYGKYRFRLVKDGYQPLDIEPELVAPWYQWPWIDFVSENIIPCTFRDVQPLHFQLQPLECVRPDDVRARAAGLRARGQAIQTPPGTESMPKPQPSPVPPPGPVPFVPAAKPNLPAPTQVLPPPTPASAVTAPGPSGAPGPSSPSPRFGGFSTVPSQASPSPGAP